MRHKLKVIHGIQEDAGLVPRIKDNVVNRHMPNLVIAVEVVDIMPPCRAFTQTPENTCVDVFEYKM